MLCQRLPSMNFRAFFLAVFFLRTVSAVKPLVELGYSRFLGTALPNGITQWLGLRFAAPPFGDLRFRAPADPPFNNTVQIANQHGPICLKTGVAYSTNTTSEDCLFLDVYAPSSALPFSPLPVLIWLQGGGFEGNSNPNLNGSGLITASDFNMVVVTFNYRVGIYGFLSGEEVQKNGDTNVGLLDQRKVMEWVQRYIINFGGNPFHVVLGGDSAGAISILHHLSAYGGIPTNLFHAVIGESQGFPPELTLPETEFQYQSVISSVGCQNATDTMACLRGTDISDLQNLANINRPDPGRPSSPLYSFAPVIDGTLIQDYHSRLFEQGRFLRMPTLFGDDSNEGTIFTPSNLNDSTDLTTFLTNQYPKLTATQADEINTLYPIGPQYPNRSAYFSAGANAYGEMRYTCPGIFVNGLIAKYRFPFPNWNYHYNVSDATEQSTGLGVPHTIEIHAVWGPENTGGSAPASYFTYNMPIIPIVQGYWTSFIRTFDPNTFRAPGSPEWQPFGLGGSRIVLQTNGSYMETVPDAQRDRCEFFNSIALSIGQ